MPVKNPIDCFKKYGVKDLSTQLQKRIDEGVKNGSITSKEQARLEKEQEHLQKKEDRIKADGKVTKRERAVLQHVEDKTSKDIYRKKHNGHHN